MQKLDRSNTWPYLGRAWWAVAGALLLATFLPACSSPSEEPEAAARPTPLVVVETVEEGTWQDTVELTTELVPRAAVTVAAEIAGRIVALPVDHGDAVARGDVVARLEVSGAEAELAQAEARLASARANVQQAERDLERGRALANADGVISKDALERFELAREIGEAARREAEAAVAVASERMADTVVQAPFAGKVSERLVELGSWVSPGDPIVRIVDRQRLRAQAAAGQQDRVQLHLGAPVTVRADALPGATFAGQLRFLGQEADTATGTYMVEAEVPAAAASNGAELLPGMRGAMTIELATRRGLVIPRTAVLVTQGGAAVFVVEAGTARRRAVEVRTISPERSEVLTGLTAGDRLVVQGQHQLADGDAVEVREP